jgi:RNA binding exosome subunit
LSTKSQPFKLKEIIYTCSAHDTEDLEKVKQAILNLTPEELHSKFEILDTILTGHAGNTIHLLELYVKSNRDIKRTLEYLASKIDDLDKEYLFDEFDKRIGEDNCLYLRFNKQDAFKKKITLEEKDNTIKVVIKFVIYKHEPDLIKNKLIEYDILRKG